MFQGSCWLPCCFFSSFSRVNASNCGITCEYIRIILLLGLDLTVSAGIQKSRTESSTSVQGLRRVQISTSQKSGQVLLVHAPVRVAEEKSSLQERKRKYVVEIDHQLFDPEEFDGINVLHAYSEKNDANEKTTTTLTKRRKGMFELIGETTIFFVEGLLGKN